MVFRQWLEEVSHTYTYLIADDKTGRGFIVDPVVETFERDCSLIEELGVKVEWVIDTHVHADHITAANLFRKKFQCKIGVSKYSGAQNADQYFNDQEQLELAGIAVQAIATPGHTDGCMSYYVPSFNSVFSGDALLIRGCGRTDFQQGSSEKLFHSVREKLFNLPDSTFVYPAHEYKGRSVSTIAEEKKFNPRLNLKITLPEFQKIMANLNLAKPAQIEKAVPMNLLCGPN